MTSRKKDPATVIRQILVSLYGRIQFNPCRRSGKMNMNIGGGKFTLSVGPKLRNYLLWLRKEVNGSPYKKKEKEVLIGKEIE